MDGRLHPWTPPSRSREDQTRIFYSHQRQMGAMNPFLHDADIDRDRDRDRAARESFFQTLGRMDWAQTEDELKILREDFRTHAQAVRTLRDPAPGPARQSETKTKTMTARSTSPPPREGDVPRSWIRSQMK